MWSRALGFVVLGLSVGCGNIGGREANPDALQGKVVTGGQPVKFVSLTVTGPDGAVAGGTTNEQGEYVIPSPSKGKLKFQFVAPAGKTTFPWKYTKANNDLSFEYTGGKQTYNIVLN